MAVYPYFRFLHSHGGTGCGSARNPFSNSETLLCARLTQDHHALLSILNPTAHVEGFLL